MHDDVGPYEVFITSTLVIFVGGFLRKFAKQASGFLLGFPGMKTQHHRYDCDCEYVKIRSSSQFDESTFLLDFL